MLVLYKSEWTGIINRDSNVSANHGGNKLRTNKRFKHCYEIESYVQLHTLSRSRRSAFAKFRSGDSPVTYINWPI